MSDLIHDRGRGHEIVGTRITVYNLLDSFLDPTVTEEEICRVYDLTPLQVAAARAYVLRNPDTILAEHLMIEERLAAGNSPQVRERAEQAKTTFLRFKQWLAEQDRIAAADKEQEGSNGLKRPTFREWIAQHKGE
jgi:uncharacterized protein (DUF433 family)